MGLIFRRGLLGGFRQKAGICQPQRRCAPRVVHYHCSANNQPRVIYQQANPVKEPVTVAIKMTTDSKNKEKETMSAPTTTTAQPTTTVVAQSTQAVSRELNTNTNTIGSHNPVTESRSQDSFTRNSTNNSNNSDSRNQSKADSRDQSSDHHNYQPQNSNNSDSRYQGRNSHNNVTINDDHSVVNDHSVTYNIGKLVDKSQKGKGNIQAGRDNSDNDSAVRSSRDDHSRVDKSWKMKKAKSKSEANGNRSSESTENNTSVDNSKKIKKKNKKAKAVVPAQEPAPAQESVQSTPTTVS
ncbi:MAG: hypothetical protein RLZZ361_24 [Cyanobacteriota bacterium]|jgi:hypothetical protein